MDAEAETESLSYTTHQPLKDVRIVIIHVKEKLDSGPPSGDVILKQMLEFEEEAQLGCAFEISKVGQAVYL